MKSEELLSEIKSCKTVQDCIEVATTDCYNEYEGIEGWVVCFEELFAKGTLIRVLGMEAELDGFECVNGFVLAAKCRKGRRIARVALDSVEFGKSSKLQKLWLKAWSKGRP